MLSGLQGSGKTTTAAKLARMYQTQGQHPLLAAADTYRPAAQDQLQTLGAELGVPVASGGQSPLEICRRGRAVAAARGPAPPLRQTARRLPTHQARVDERKAMRPAGAAHHVG